MIPEDSAEVFTVFGSFQGNKQNELRFCCNPPKDYLILSREMWRKTGNFLDKDLPTLKIKNVKIIIMKNSENIRVPQGVP